MKISYAIALSLVGHGMVLMPWGDAADFAVNSTPASYQVSLVKQPVQKQEKTTAQPDKPVEQTKPVSHPLQQSAQQAKAAEAIETATTSVDKQTTENERQVLLTKIPSAEVKAYVISRLNHALEHHFRYPLLARRNGWQGKVVLGLSVDAQGGIGNVHIKAGSGYRILDQSALDALLKIKQIQTRDHWSSINQLEIILPVIYQLHKG